MKRLSIISMILLLMQLNAYTQDEHLYKLLPEASDLDRVEMVGQPRVYTSEDLHEITPKVADLIIEYGFEKAIVADYKDDERGESYHLEIFEMSDLYASYGIFTILQLYDETPDDIGEEGQIVNNEAIFVQGKYVVRIIGDKEDENNETELKNAADFIASGMESKGVKNLPVIQNLIQILPLEDQALPTVKFLRGYRSLNMVYHFYDEDIWGFDGGVAGYYPWYTIIILRYADREKGTAQFNFLRKLGSISDNFQSYYSASSSTFQMTDKHGTRLSFNYYNGFFIIFIYRGKMNMAPLMKEIKYNLDIVFN